METGKTEGYKMNQLNCLKTDPMKNDLILERIFQFCDVPSLKSCRLVCPKWRDLSLKSWRSKAILQLTTWPREERLDSGEYVELLQSNPDSEEGPFQLRKYPFKRYSLDLEKCSPLQRHDRDEKNDKRRLIAMTLGHWGLRHVQLIWGEECYGFRQMMAILTLNHSLKSIEVSFETLSYDVPSISRAPLERKRVHVKRLKLFARHLTWEHSVERSLWPFILETCPHLEALSVGYNFREEDGSNYYTKCLLDRIEMTKLIRDMRLAGLSGGDRLFETFPLKELEMIDCHSMQRDGSNAEATVIEQLAECKFPLEKLSFHVGYYDCDNEDVLILPLLESCKDTLQYLKLSINFQIQPSSDKLGYEARTGIKFTMTKTATVRMEQLKEICLLNGLEWAMFFLPDLELPQLEKLSVEYDSERNHEQRSGKVSIYLKKNHKVYEKLQTFELLDNEAIPRVKTIRKFAKMMPNVVHLTIPLDKITFPHICHHFKGLKSLHVLEGKGDYVELDDEALTGLSKSRPRRPNITDLEHLTDLTICCQRQLQRNHVKITEHSVLEGFLHMPRLFNLSVAIKEMSEQVREKLELHVKGNLSLQRKPSRPDPFSFEVEILSEESEED